MQAHTVLGPAVYGEENSALTFLGFGAKARQDTRIHSYTEKQTAFLTTVHQAVEHYLNGRPLISVPLQKQGTPFQQQVWQAFPTQGTCTYSELAVAVNKPKAARAVASACAKNPISLFRPCHRVLGKDHNLRGYAWGTDIKQKLLELEQGAIFHG